MLKFMFPCCVYGLYQIFQCLHAWSACTVLIIVLLTTTKTLVQGILCTVYAISVGEISLVALEGFHI